MAYPNYIVFRCSMVDFVSVNAVFAYIFFVRHIDKSHKGILGIIFNIGECIYAFLVFPENQYPLSRPWA